MKQPNVQGLMLPSHVVTPENDIYPMVGVGVRGEFC